MFWLYISLASVLLYFLYDRLKRRPQISHIDQKYVVITGCDTGFGHAAAKRFDQLGCHVIAGCLSPVSVEELQRDCSSRLLAVTMDVSKDDDVIRAAEVITKHIPKGQGLHALINNAGLLGPVGPLEWLNTEKIHFVLNINLYGMIRVTNVLLPLLKQCKGSRIVNTASVAGRTVLANTGAYCISKHAVEAYSDQIRRELRVFGISVHTIEPGSHMTKFMQRDLVVNNAKSQWDGLTQSMRDEYGQAYYDKMIELSTVVIPSISTSTKEGVVNAYQHATLARCPKTRYSIGADSPIYIIYSYLPSWIQDWAVSIKFLEPRPTTYKA